MFAFLIEYSLLIFFLKFLYVQMFWLIMVQTKNFQAKRNCSNKTKKKSFIDEQTTVNHSMMPSSEKFTNVRNPFPKVKKSDEETQLQSSFFVAPSLSFKRTGRSLTIIHKKHLRVWCMRPEIDSRHPGRNTKLWELREIQSIYFSRKMCRFSTKNVMLHCCNSQFICCW